MRKRIENTENKRKPRKRPQTDPQKGLSAEQVAQRKAAGKQNLPLEDQSLTLKQIILKNVFTYFNMIFYVIAVLLIIVGSFKDLTFLIIIFGNMLIGIIQEYYAACELKKVKLIREVKIKAIRDGKSVLIPSSELVLDDIVIFEAGEQICADAVVIDGEAKVNEAMLTGEADDIDKAAGSKLLSGSTLVAGKCKAQLTAVGKDSYIADLTAKAKKITGVGKSEMMRSLNRLLIVIGIIIIPIGALLFYQSYALNGATVSESIQSMAAAVVGMIPEGIYLLTSVALAAGTARLLARQVLLHDMSAIEMLARTDVLCVDKTGTITEDSMTVESVIPAPGLSDDEKRGLDQILGNFVWSMSPDNSTMKALQGYFADITGIPAKKVFPFTSATKYSAAIFDDKSYVLGAPEFVLRNLHLEYRMQLEEYAAQGYRVVVFCEYAGVLTGGALTEEAKPLGCVLIRNAIRKEAPDTFRYFAEQGVTVKVISGDNALAVSEIAKKAGIENADKYVDATTLKNENDIYNAAKEYTVFGRVMPDQKRQLVHALKKQGHTVAMTGDGVNDILALKDADCSIAMASGSDAAAQVAKIVLLDSNFAALPSVVSEGRRVVNNIQRSSSLFFVKNLFSIFLAILSIILVIDYPFQPTQLFLISFWVVGLPAFLLALQSNDSRISKKFFGTMMRAALPAGITGAFLVEACVVYLNAVKFDTGEIPTIATYLLAIVSFMILYQICKPYTLIRFGILALSVVGFFACVFVSPEIFAIETLSMSSKLLIIIYMFATESIMRLTTNIINGAAGTIKKYTHKKSGGTA